MGKQEYYEQIGVAMTCRGFAEYERMFGLDERTMALGKVLDMAAGASSFPAEARARGIEVVCADPRYALPPEQLANEGYAEIEASTQKLSKLEKKFDWTYYGSLEQHRAGRLRSLELFLQDYEARDGQESYVAASLPKLPFADGAFGLVLCSHFLFLYADQFDEAFHRAALEELLRVCAPGGEVRIYPLLSLKWEPYAGLESLIAHLTTLGAECERLPSKLPFIPGSSELLRLRKAP